MADFSVREAYLRFASREAGAWGVGVLPAVGGGRGV